MPFTFQVATFMDAGVSAGRVGDGNRGAVDQRAISRAPGSRFRLSLEDSAAGSAKTTAVRDAFLMIASILSNAWRVFREQFATIGAVVVVVWLPCELLSSYCDAFVFGEEDFRRSLKLTQFLENFVGIIATAGVTFIAMNARLGQPVSFGSAMGAGLRSWGRMWWTRFLSALVILIAFLMLIIPGVYVATRLAFAESVAVIERVSGTRAMGRSFELTEGRFWGAFRLGIALGAVVVLPSMVLFLPIVYFPALDYWLIDAAVALLCDLIAAFGAVMVTCGYELFSQAEDDMEGAAAPGGQEQ